MHERSTVNAASAHYSVTLEKLLAPYCTVKIFFYRESYDTALIRYTYNIYPVYSAQSLK